MNTSLIRKTLLVAALALTATQSFAASTWALATGAATGSTADGNLTSMTAYSADLSPLANFRSVNWQNYGGGVGVQGDGSSDPNHAVDNVGELEGLFLNFSKSVVLNTVTIGWHNTANGYGKDSDISVLRYVGTKTTVAEVQATITGSNKSTMTSNGWELVGNYSDLVDNQGKATGAADTQGSSWWFVSAYNSGYVASANTRGTTSNLSDGDEYIKILSVAGNVTKTPPGGGGGKVPEPGSLALLGLAMASMVAVRRRQQQK